MDKCNLFFYGSCSILIFRVNWYSLIWYDVMLIDNVMLLIYMKLFSSIIVIVVIVKMLIKEVNKYKKGKLILLYFVCIWFK